MVQILLSSISCVLLFVFVISSFFNYYITKEVFIKNIDNNSYINMQKEKLTKDLESVCLANGVNFDVFKGFIKDDNIKKNDEEYIENVFSYINGGLSKIPAYTQTAIQFEKDIIKTLVTYSEDLEKDYIINQNSIISFASLEKSNFAHSAVPILGFERIVIYLKKYNNIINIAPIYLAVGVLASLLILLLFNKRRKYYSIAHIFYSFSASGILLSIMNGFLLWVIINKNTALNSSYLKNIFLIFTKNSLIVGIMMFVLSQLALILIFYFKSKKQNLRR